MFFGFFPVWVFDYLNAGFRRLLALFVWCTASVLFISKLFLLAIHYLLNPTKPLNQRQSTTYKPVQPYLKLINCFFSVFKRLAVFKQ